MLPSGKAIRLSFWAVAAMTMHNAQFMTTTNFTDFPERVPRTNGRCREAGKAIARITRKRGAGKAISLITRKRGEGLGLLGFWNDIFDLELVYGCKGNDNC